jgi:hypothetical protein
MTALELHKFYHGNLEYHWHYDNEKVSGHKEDVILFVEIYSISTFMKLTSVNNREEGYECVMKNGYFCFWMADICERFGIELTEVFPQ